MTMTEFALYVKGRKTIVLPFGAIEAHGSHLPVDTDARIVGEVVKEVGLSTGVLVAPVVPYGVCTSTGRHAGTISVTPPTLRAIATDIVTDAYSKGLRNFILVSGHAGSIHVCALREAAETLVRTLEGVRMAVFSLYDIVPASASEIIETANDSHAGEAETSLIMRLAPHLLKGEGAEEFPKLPKLFVVKDKTRYWPGAVWGDPRMATKEKGDALFRLMVEKLSEVVVTIETTDL